MRRMRQSDIDKDGKSKCTSYDIVIKMDIFASGFSEPCGGAGRGSCDAIHVTRENFSPQPRDDQKNDDRLQWPTRFFKYACRCEDGFAGYMCHECQFGLKGEKCNKTHNYIRRNVLSLNNTEKKQLIDVFDKAKNTNSDYVVMDATSGLLDPVKRPRFYNITVFDFFVYLHFYGTRNTQQRNGVCNSVDQPFDFVHNGPGFATWHRYFLLSLEREFQKLLNDDSFGLPYFQWTGQRNGSCEICSTDLFGKNYVNGSIEQESVFSKWKIICERKQMNGCDICDPSERLHHLTRIPGGDKDHPSMPDRSRIEFSLKASTFAILPFSEKHNTSFINNLEGYSDVGGQKNLSTMHNKVRVLLP